MGENSIQDNRGSFRRENRLEVKGLKNHLDTTASSHKDHGYNDFVEMVHDGQSRAAIAKMFGVDFRTADHWLKVYKQEQLGNKNGLHQAKK